MTNTHTSTYGAKGGGELVEAPFRFRYFRFFLSTHFLSLGLQGAIKNTSRRWRSELTPDTSQRPEEDGEGRETFPRPALHHQKPLRLNYLSKVIEENLQLVNKIT